MILYLFDIYNLPLHHELYKEPLHNNITSLFTHPQYNVQGRFAFLHPQRLFIQLVVQLHDIHFSADSGMPLLIIKIGFKPISVISHSHSVG